MSEQVQILLAFSLAGNGVWIMITLIKLFARLQKALEKIERL